MFDLTPLRQTRVWQEAYEEGFKKGLKKGKKLYLAKLVHYWLAKGMKPKKIANLLDCSVSKVRRLAKEPTKDQLRGLHSMGVNRCRPGESGQDKRKRRKNQLLAIAPAPL